MSPRREKYRKTICALLPLSAASISALLGSATPSHANPTAFSGSKEVAERLAAARAAVSANLLLAAERPGPRKPKGWRKFWGNW